MTATGSPQRRGDADPDAGAGAQLWSAADSYERYMGRWSRLVAAEFLDALAVRPGSRWLDVGCGVGSLTATIVDRAGPSTVTAVDTSEAFLEHAATRTPLGAAVRFERADARDLPFPAGAFDAAVSGLALNFVPDPERALAEMARVTRTGGTVAAYVWDYDEPDFFLTRFWKAVADATSSPAAADERGRWPICSPDGIARLAARTTLTDVRTWTIRVATEFAGADELWEGFLLGVGPSGMCAVGLDGDARAAVRAAFEARLPVADDGRVPLSATAVALAGIVR